MTRVLDWQNLTGAKIASLDPAQTVVVVSCSPLEVHGPHLPTAADMCEAEGLFTRTLAILADDHPDLVFVRLPPVYVAADVSTVEPPPVEPPPVDPPPVDPLPVVPLKSMSPPLIAEGVIWSRVTTVSGHGVEAL